MIGLYPWDYGVKPHYVNNEGFEWYFDKSTTLHATRDKAVSANHTRKGMKNVAAFYVKKGDKFSSVLIDDNQEIIAEHETAIGLCCRIDVLLVWEDFATRDDRETLRERKSYIKELSKLTDEEIEPLKIYTENRKDIY